MPEKNNKTTFNPNEPAGKDANIFGLPYTENESALILLPIPWEATVSYATGTAEGPEAIFEASKQVDLYDPIYADGWKQGIYMRKIDKAIKKMSRDNRKLVEKLINHLTGTEKMKQNALDKAYDNVNKSSIGLNKYIHNQTKQLLGRNKLVGLVGGDHSTPFGYIKALAEYYAGQPVSVLQFDAHCDLRKAYEGFTYSHASVMYNVLAETQISKLTQVGIRDYCNEEQEFIEMNKSRVNVFFDADIKRSLFCGESWHTVCKQIIDTLPDLVYISFDIDALDPKLCPNTGTPVPGGLEFDQAVYLMNMLTDCNKKIIGFDLNEVAPGTNEWDANVGARLLYKMCTIALKSRSRSEASNKSVRNEKK